MTVAQQTESATDLLRAAFRAVRKIERNEARLAESLRGDKRGIRGRREGGEEKERRRCINSLSSHSSRQLEVMKS